MTKPVRQYRRTTRRQQRRARRAYNQKLKQQGYTWAQRRRMVRNRRRYDRNVRRKGVAERRMEHLDRNVESPRESQQLARMRQQRGAPERAPVPRPAPQPVRRRPMQPAPWARQPLVPAPWAPPVPVRPQPGPTVVHARQRPTVMRDWDVPERALEWDDGYELDDPWLDAMENAVLVDEGYWDNDPVEYEYDVADVAGEIAGRAYARISGGAIGADDDVESVIDDVGLRLIAEVRVYAHEDGWSPQALQAEAAKIIDATNAVEDAVSGAGALEGVGAGAALMALPALASLAQPLLQNRAERLERRRDRESNQAERRQRRQARRAEDLEARIEELERLGPRAGVLDVDSEDWGPSAKTDNVLVRARNGKRAALASLGRGYYLVREVSPDEPQADVQTEMARVASLASPALAAVQAVSGDHLGCDRCRGGCHG